MGETMFDNFSADGVPSWVTIVAVVFGFFGVVLGLITMIDPGFQNIPGDATFLGHQLGGRSMGLGVVMIAAIILRQRAGYLVGFIAGLFRDLGDLIAGFGDGPISPIVPVIMMGVGIYCIWSIVQATNKLMAAEASRTDRQ